MLSEKKEARMRIRRVLENEHVYYGFDAGNGILVIIVNKDTGCEFLGTEKAIGGPIAIHYTGTEGLFRTTATR